MELLLIMIYVSICYVVFKIFRIPVNQWSLATAALGGIIGIALLLLIMNYNHPFTKNARIYFSVTPVLPTVRGPVIEVPVKENAPLKEGDVLFRIDPKPYEYVVEQKKAALAPARRVGRCRVGSRSDCHTRAGGGIRHPSRIAARRVRRPGAAAAGDGLRQHGCKGPSTRRGVPAEFPAAGQGGRRCRGRLRRRPRSRVQRQGAPRPGR